MAFEILGHRFGGNGEVSYLTAKGKRKHIFDWLWLFYSGSGIFGVLIALIMALADPGSITISNSVELLMAALVLAACGLPFYLIIRRRKRQSNARKIAMILDLYEYSYITSDELNNRMGIKNAMSKVTELLRTGYLQNIEADVDRGIVRLLAPNKHARVVDTPKPAEPPRPAVPPKPEPVSLKKETSKNDQKAAVYDDAYFAAKILEIRRLNDDIAHVAVSEKIDRIEALTSDIFRIIREKPEREEDARKFLNYYLPTTLKLLQSYRLMERQGFQSETITESRMKIESTLDMLIMAITQQRDKMLQADVLDVDTDITVLESMMSADGLSGRYTMPGR